MIIQLIFSLHLPKRIAHVFNAVYEISLIINSSSSFSSVLQVGAFVFGGRTPTRATGLQPCSAKGAGTPQPPRCVWGQTLPL